VSLIVWHKGLWCGLYRIVTIIETLLLL